jgi:hypothetical protein
MDETKWVQQIISADDPGAMDVEWDTFNIGTVEQDRFRTIYACWSKEDADFLLTALRWYTSFKEGKVMGLEPGVALPKKIAKKKIAQ